MTYIISMVWSNGPSIGVQHIRHTSEDAVKVASEMVMAEFEKEKANAGSPSKAPTEAEVLEVLASDSFYISADGRWTVEIGMPDTED